MVSRTVGCAFRPSKPTKSVVRELSKLQGKVRRNGQGVGSSTRTKLGNPESMVATLSSCHSVLKVALALGIKIANLPPTCPFSTLPPSIPIQTHRPALSTVAKIACPFSESTDAGWSDPKEA